MLTPKTRDRVVRNGLFKEMTFRLTSEAKLGANRLNSQEKNAADRGNGTCTGLEEGENVQ